MAKEIYQRQLSEANVLTEDLYFYVPECNEITGDWIELQSDSKNQRWCVDTESGTARHRSDIGVRCFRVAYNDNKARLHA